MVIELFNEKFERIGYLNRFIEFSWTSKFYDSGQFSIYIRQADYESDWKYVIYNDEIAKIQSVEFEQTVKGDFVTLTGFMLTKELNNGIIYPMFSFSSSSGVVSQIKTCIDTYCPPIGCASKSYSAKTIGEGISAKTVDKQQTGGGVYDCLQPILETLEIGSIMHYERSLPELQFQLKIGTDRSTGGNMVIFKRQLGNIKSINATIDDSNLKNYAIVAGQGEGSERISVEVDIRSNTNEPKRVLWVDANDLQMESTLAVYKNQLKQRGLEKLLEYQVIENIELKTLDRAFLFGENYQLGDYVLAVIDEIGLNIRVQITEAETVLKGGKKEITLTLGNQKKVKYRRYL